MIDNIVYKSGKPILRLNQRIIVQKGLTQEQVDAIKDLHLERMNIESPYEAF